MSLCDSSGMTKSERGAQNEGIMGAGGVLPTATSCIHMKKNGTRPNRRILPQHTKSPITIVISTTSWSIIDAGPMTALYSRIPIVVAPNILVPPEVPEDVDDWEVGTANLPVRQPHQ